MKASLFGKFTCCAPLLLLPFLGGCTPAASSTPPAAANASAASNAVVVASAEAEPVAEIVSAPDPLPPEPAAPAPPDPDLASVAPDNGTPDLQLPTYIYPTSPLAQVIRLSQAGVDDSIIQAFIANSSGAFNLNSDKIIYLKDIGVPKDIVTAMMQRDQQLFQQLAASSQPVPQPAPPDTPTTETEPAPPPAEQPAPPPTTVTVNYFYDTLAPYGSWITVNGYGNCWRPSVCMYNPGWRPYCDHGRWIYTDCGWYWYSDYSWGWAPFHYGRWFQHPHWGWCWAPDTIWGPSWVTWRYSSGYCGWAPLPPFSAYQAGIGFFYRGGSVSIGFNWGLGENCYTFVPVQHFCDPYPRRHSLPPGQVTQIFNQTAVINNYGVRNHDHRFINRGIEPDRITAVTRTPIHPVSIRSSSAPPGRNPHVNPIGRNGSTLAASQPPRAGFPTITQPSQQTDNRSTLPGRSVRPSPGPGGATRSHQESGAIRVAPRSPAPPAYDRSPPAPNYGGHTYSPRQWQQSQPSPTPRSSPNNAGSPSFIAPSRPGPSGASGHAPHSAPAAGPAPQPPQHSQPAAPAPSAPRSSGQNQNQNSFGNSPGTWNGNAGGPGSGFGPRH
jgi:hypothetical protein